ncbi:MAG: hypothetical protein K9G41_01760 [Flavobacteriales bacterium]|nr:hypothetical protein [Flavobacteriales bacterium]
MKHITTAILVLFVSSLAFGQARRKADKDTENWRYELEVVNEGAQGTYLIKIWSYSKKPQVAFEQAKKNAVHGIVFKGYTGAGRIKGQKALVQDPSAEITHEAFFKEFFADNGKYMKFVQLTTDGAIAPGDIMKAGKKEYKVGIVVAVNKDDLRNYLESEKIIRGLSSGF